MLMYCIDADSRFIPDGEWMRDKTEFDYMSGDEACALVRDKVEAIYPEVCDSFEIEFQAHPAHAEDMRAKVTEILAQDWMTPDELEFYERKHGLYDGCIAEADDYYFIEGQFRFDDIPVLRGVMSFPHELYVDGPTIWAIVGKDGMVYMECNNLLRICKEESREPVERTSDEVLAKAGEFLDNIIGLEPFEIDRVELIYVPYPIAVYEYEMTPALVLSEYDAETGRYTDVMRVNAMTGEMIF